ncbi:hypothetical protein [Vibrio hippocampi]|uniref:DUF2066 domain-containing protein n=1 Tax=Vibrio hippocampi TaxID=654686 RepID=A0ABN8DD41_9VIBR|nr:hypothetical protein [Vibrio hippocampi]CAH0524214.1 hypothetical protein VHP8226_00006 [Vibrio hippocampi]
MLQGKLASLLLLLASLTSSAVMASKEMTQQQADSLLASSQVQDKVSELMTLFTQQDINELEFALDRISLPQQEVARYLLLQRIEQNKVVFTTLMAEFVEQQRSIMPVYTITERGDGYLFTVPAFNYPAISARLTKSWNQDQLILDFIMNAENHDLDLQQWLSMGNEWQQKNREEILIQEFDSLTPQAANYLIDQITNVDITRWLPSSRVLVVMAQVSQNEALYQLLWKMRADVHSQQELERLASLQTPFAHQQMIYAAHNPSLKQQAIAELAKINPLPTNVRDFLVVRMTVSADASFVATQLAQNGHRLWLHNVVSTNGQIKASIVLKALSNYQQ